jgi:3-isopropylmalate/(R)-2-methylmalate dehydratase large subunit
VTARTAVEKLIGAHCDRPVTAGELVVTAVDAVMATDGNAPLSIRLLRGELGSERVFDPARVILVIDHCAPAPNEGSANLQREMREFAAATGALLYEAGEGISHVVLPEKGHARPGALIVGSDSHTVTYGAVNCLGTGMGSTDIAVAMHTGRTWLRVPETIRVTLSGRLPAGVTAKDLALHLVALIGVDGATYRCLEVDGEGLADLGMDGRFSVCNMAVEMGAKCVLMPVDERCAEYLRARGVPARAAVSPDEGCAYEAVHEVRMEDVQPLIACPHELTNLVPVREVAGRPIDLAFIGTCTNGRLSDLEAAARVLGSRRLAPGVRMVVTPGSKEVFLEAMRQGLVERFMEAGAVVTPPGCGPCVGTHQGIPGDGDVVISSANRNFRGRMGNPSSSIYVASPETVMASAVLGRIATAGELA